MVKKLSIIIVVAMLAVILFTGNVNANLQSRPGVTSLYSKTASEFFELCRKMETSSGPLGLNATIGVQSNKVVESSSSNNIDVHMIKNTEYGAAAILSASDYGACPTGNSDTASTTGNNSGIMQMAGGKYEYVAGIYNTRNSRY